MGRSPVERPPTSRRSRPQSREKEGAEALPASSGTLLAIAQIVPAQSRGGGGGVLQPCPVPSVWRRYNGKPPRTTSGQRLPVPLARSVPTALLSRVSVR